MTMIANHAAAAMPAARPVPLPDIAFSRFRLANGLTLIVHEDQSVPLIAAELRYNVGSKDEPAGRFGFAHLFEHLMFRESANRRGSWHTMLADLGGTNVNGTTSYDRTNYYQTVPTGSIDTVLWMESDRMGHLLEGLTRETLDGEVDVVKNEKRERESAPLGSLAEVIAGVLYPIGHPYGHTVIGTVEDLDRATLETARHWYRSWYGAGNAVLVLAGDITPEDALAKVEHWFGDLPKGPPVRRATRWLPAHQGAQRLFVEDRVGNPGVALIWSVPGYGDPDTVDLGLLANALTGRPDALLVRRLVEKEQLCTAVEASVERRQLCSEFCISATFAAGADGARIEAIIQEALDAMLREGPSQDDIDQSLRAGRMAIRSSIESLASRAEMLAMGEMQFEQPDAYRQVDAIAAAATPERVAAAGRRWLQPSALTIDIRPYSETSVHPGGPDRTLPPGPQPISTPPFPSTERATLRNGIQVRLAIRPNATTVAALLVLEDGTVGDPLGEEGLTAATAAQLTNGTTRLDRSQLEEWQRRINTSITARATLETTSVRCNTLPDDVADAIALMGEIALQPAFPSSELDRMKRRALDDLATERATMATLADRASTILTFGESHATARRPTGDAASIGTLAVDRLRVRHASLFRPEAASIFVSGNVRMSDILAPLELAFGDWTVFSAAAPAVRGAFAPRPGRYLVERGGVEQSTIIATLASPAFARPFPIGPALGVFTHIVGGSFGSRLNLNLRQRRGWTYGVNSAFARLRDTGCFTIRTAVQADKTNKAMDEIVTELAAILAERPITMAEIEVAQQALLLEMPSYWTSHDAILAAMVDSHRYDLPDDHYDRLAIRMLALTLADINRIANIVCAPGALSIVVAGDPSCFAAERLEKADRTLL